MKMMGMVFIGESESVSRFNVEYRREEFCFNYFG